jgi:hypothetical protein
MEKSVEIISVGKVRYKWKNNIKIISKKQGVSVRSRLKWFLGRV